VNHIGQEGYAEIQVMHSVGCILRVIKKCQGAVEYFNVVDGKEKRLGSFFFLFF
jgi:hypothetical protein